MYHTYYELCKTTKILECLRVFQLLRAKNDVVNYCSFKLKTVSRHPNCSYPSASIFVLKMFFSFSLLERVRFDVQLKSL